MYTIFCNHSANLILSSFDQIDIYFQSQSSKRISLIEVSMNIMGFKILQMNRKDCGCFPDSIIIIHKERTTQCIVIEFG